MWSMYDNLTKTKRHLHFRKRVLMTFKNMHPQSFYISQTVTSVSMLNTQEYSCTGGNQSNFLTARYSNNLNNLYF
jgi:hypothetical protein